MKYEPGTKVVIIDDCREGKPANGQVGIYEGDFPRAAVVLWNGEYIEYDYQEFEDVGGTNDENLPHFDTIIDKLNEYENEHPEPKAPGFDATDEEMERYVTESQQWRKESGINYWYESNNPRIRLEDGSIIWGAECWWRPYDDKPADDNDAEKLQVTKEFYRAMLGS